MAINTYGVTLKDSASDATYVKLVDIKDFPDLGGAPESLETTTLSDAAQVYINGIQSASPMEFTANYVKATYDAIKATANTARFYQLEFGDAGAEGIFKWQGQHSVWIVGAGVNGVVEMKISIAPSTQVLKSA